MVAVITLLAAICLSLRTCTAEGDEKPSITLLLLVPMPDNRPQAGWDAGPDLQIGATIAARHVNNNTAVLPDYDIELVVAGHEACGLLETNLGISNLVRYGIVSNSLGGRSGVAAVIGLYCSTSTKAISRVASHPNINMLQLTVSNSPIFVEQRASFPHLWHFLESASIYATMMTTIMDQYSWTRVAVVHNTENAFNLGIANAFTSAIAASPDKELVYEGILIEFTETLIEEVILNIQQNGVFVIFVTVSSPQAAVLFCKAAQYNMVWPQYVWVVADYLVSFILDNNDDFCPQSELKKALEGSIMSYFSLQPDDPSSTMLDTNITYQDYLDEYRSELRNVEGTTATGESEYAAASYDQVWAFSKALHNALPELQRQNLSIEDYHFGQPEITNILEGELRKLNYRGATGQIQFSSNQEVSTSIKIYQVRNTSEEVIGQFDASRPESFSIDLGTAPPSDRVTPDQIVLPLSLFCVLLIVSIIILCLVTINFILMIILHDHSEIRAISPSLSSLIYIGCYCECVAAILLLVEAAIPGLSPTARAVMCNIGLCSGFIGLYLIIITMTVRLARIFRIFTRGIYGGKIGFMWKDRALFVIILGISSYVIVVFVFWLIFDTLKYESEIIYYNQMFPVRAEEVGRCNSRYFLSIWMLLLYLVLAVIEAALIVFAIQTRSVKISDFKDTKKVILFAFAVSILNITFTTAWIILRANGVYSYSSAVMGSLFLAICLASQLLLFVPKLYPTIFRVIREKRQGSSPESTTDPGRTSFSYALDPSASNERPAPHTFTKTIRVLLKKQSTFDSN